MPSMHAVSASIVLTDNHHFNGPLMLIPGSHKVFVPCLGATPDDHHKQSLKTQEFGVPRQRLRPALRGPAAPSLVPGPRARGDVDAVTRSGVRVRGV